MKTPRRWQRRLLVGLALTFAAAWLRPSEPPGAPAGSGTRLGIEGTRFTLNGQPAFLYGLSYYGALGATEQVIKRDLDQAQRLHFNWLRVWATWAAFGTNVAAVEAEGGPREPFLAKLQWLVAECDRRGLVVDVTLSRGNGVTGPANLQTLAAHRRAVETLVTALKPWRNWYLDLSNERNVQDQRFTSFDELQRLRELARQLDPDRLVTASHAGDLGREDARKYLEEVKLDFLCPHRSRGAGSPAKTDAKTRECLAWMKELGRLAPLHYQEPFRRGYGKWEPQAADYLADLRGARAGGAAGWCFHNGSQRGQPDSRPRRSFDLRQQRLFDQLDQEELKALADLAAELAPALPDKP
jgi:hypothetical protein